MFETIRRLKSTFLSLVFSLLFLVLSIWLDLDLFERVSEVFHEMEAYELDELILVLVVVLTALSFDLRRDRLARTRENLRIKERMLTFQTTMRTVLDLVGNALNSMLLFRIEAEERGALQQRSLQAMDKLIYETQQQLVQLANTTEISEEELASGFFSSAGASPSQQRKELMERPAKKRRGPESSEGDKH